MHRLHRIAVLCISVAAAFCLGAQAWAAPDIRQPDAAASNTFAVDLYQALRGRSGNLFFSPLNIWTALSMAQAGAAGETAAEMRRVLHLSGPPGGRPPSLAPDQAGVKLDTANAVWLQRGFVLNPSFERRMASDFASTPQRVDFHGDPQGARRTINTWVADRTAGKVQDLLPEPPPGPMVITSAVYMKADWAQAFGQGATHTDSFYTAAGKSVRTPLMTMTARRHYLKTTDFQAVEIPYRGQTLSMVVILPNRTPGLEALEARLKANRLDGWLKALDASLERPVELSLPKFRLDDRFDLQTVLPAMGMRLAFTDAADFSGMTHEARLIIEQVLHKSHVSVDEKGTEAAAATAVVAIRVSLMRLNPPGTAVFRADHPFLFLIKDNRSGAIVFIGRLSTPTPFTPDTDQPEARPGRPAWAIALLVVGVLAASGLGWLALRASRPMRAGRKHDR